MRNFPPQSFRSAGSPNHHLRSFGDVGDFFLPAVMADVEACGAKRRQLLVWPTDGNHGAEFLQGFGKKLLGCLKGHGAEPFFRPGLLGDAVVELEGTEIEDGARAARFAKGGLSVTCLELPGFPEVTVAEANQKNRNKE